MKGAELFVVLVHYGNAREGYGKSTLNVVATSIESASKQAVAYILKNEIGVKRGDVEILSITKLPGELV